MSNFWESKKFKALEVQWKKKLDDSGFEDIEEPNGNLKIHNRRTIAFLNRDTISTFYYKLDSFLTNTKKLPATHRKILTLHSRGIHVKGSDGIAVQVKKAPITVYRVIRKYKQLILSLSDDESE